MIELLKTSLIPESLQLIQKISTFQSRWKIFTNLERDFYTSLKKTVIITSAGASTRIEGATLSDDEIISRLSGLKIQKIRDRDEAEVVGYIDCKKYIFDNHDQLKVTEHTMRSLHQMMMSYLPESVLPLSQRGVYKNVVNSVVRVDHATGEQQVIFETTPPGAQTSSAMHELIKTYHDYIDDPNYLDLEVIAAFIVTFLAVHPFRDGNGRMSRLLTDLCLIQRGYDFCMYSSQEKVIEDSKEQYYVALRQTQSTLKSEADINPWFLYFLKVLSRQTRHLADKVLPPEPGTLTKRERQVFALVQKHQPVTIGFLESVSGIKRVTLKSILSRLQKSGVLEMQGERKGARYVLKM